jgi:hypothetical protein
MLKSDHFFVRGYIQCRNSHSGNMLVRRSVLQNIRKCQPSRNFINNRHSWLLGINNKRLYVGQPPGNLNDDLLLFSGQLQLWFRHLSIPSAVHADLRRCCEALRRYVNAC